VLNNVQSFTEAGFTPSTFPCQSTFENGPYSTEYVICLTYQHGSSQSQLNLWPETWEDPK
jgi:hypothetical protein